MKTDTNLTEAMRETLKFDRNDKQAIKLATQTLGSLEVINAVLLCRNQSGEQPNPAKFEEYIRQGILLFLFWAEKAPGFEELHHRVEMAWYALKGLPDFEYMAAFNSQFVEDTPLWELYNVLSLARLTMQEYVDEL